MPKDLYFFAEFAPSPALHGGARKLKAVERGDLAFARGFDALHVARFSCPLLRLLPQRHSLAGCTARGRGRKQRTADSVAAGAPQHRSEWQTRIGV
jgi:hypothetical protein